MQNLYARNRHQSDKRAELVVDAQSGRILHSYKSDHIRHPASLTKLMTLYMTFEALDSGKITPDSKIIISRYAANRPPSKLGLRVGRSITVRDAVYTLIIKSANDIAAAVAEKLGGSEEKFAQMMTLKARKIGMTRTFFKNASGLPNIRQVTTARDMAVLAAKLMHDFPHYYKYFKTLNKNVAGIPLRTHNHLLKTYKGMDGMKTGFIYMSGFNLVSSAQRDGKRLITVVMGGSTYYTRDKKVAQLTDMGWQRLKDPRGYKQFLGISIPNLTALNAKFRPLEEQQFKNAQEDAVQPISNPTASLVYKNPIEARNAIASTKDEVINNNNDYLSNKNNALKPIKTQEIKPKKLTKISAYYKLDDTKKVKNSGWTHPNANETNLIDAIIDNSFQKQNYPNDPVFHDSSLIDNDINISNHHSWTIQVGAFSQKNIADNYLLLLINEYDQLSTAQPELIAVRKGKDYIYRARFTGLSAKKAKESCKLLKKFGHHCVTANNAS